jgi:hypothetical protein
MNLLLKEYIRTLLTELRVQDNRTNKDNDSAALFSYRDKIWFFDANSDQYEISEELEGQVPEDVLRQFNDEGTGTDWIFAYIDDGELQINAMGFSHHPKTSLLAKKIVNQFNLKGANYHSSYDDWDHNEDLETYFIPSEMKGELPDVLFHGTTSASIRDIMRTGLRPGAQLGKTNWPHVWHDKAVSLTVKKGEARFHGTRAAQMNKSLPIVLHVQVPDKNRIMADFDVDSQTDKTTYPGKHLPAWGSQARAGRGSLKTSIDVGTVAYNGRIPAKFIRRIEYFDPMHERWYYADNIEEIEEAYEMSDFY